MLTHALPQRVSGALHTKSHVPLLQTGVPPAGAVHWLPQLPQLFTSLFCGCRQLLPHLKWGVWQTKSHWPPLQNGMPFVGAEQTAPHAPQFPRSFEMFVSQPVA
jgi:hypothetical protein